MLWGEFPVDDRNEEKRSGREGKGIVEGIGREPYRTEETAVGRSRYRDEY